MMNHNAELKLFAATIYEIRGLLSHHLGSISDSDDCVRLAAHLSYALHNEALNLLEYNQIFDIASAKNQISQAEAIVGSEFSDEFKILK